MEPTNADDCLRELVRIRNSGGVIAYHGAYHNWQCIRSSLDLHFEDKKIPPKGRLEHETRLLTAFVQKTEPHLPPGARQHVEMARLRWGTLRNTGTLYVGRHYGLPTRCVDWTSNPLTGLFFACRRGFDEEGVVWWMNYDEFSNHVRQQWRGIYNRTGDVEDCIEQDFKNGIEKTFLTPLHYPPWMERPRKQAAWITFAGQYNVLHNQAIRELGLRNCGRIIIKARLKRKLLNWLKQMGVTGASLGVGDKCIETIRAEVVEQLG